jgi:lipopolysaccharide transport system ATP-binding protein
MSETVIKVENLSKQYRIGAREGYRTFRETLVDAAKAPLQGLSKVFNRRSAVGGRSSSSDNTIWALKDVSFEVKQGEVVGIIGRNGAGKSTLLKILSRITEPTEGRVELRGRVGSLLEVGTGFHPELTGHENIYLYGAILGMDRWEVTRKFDEIVAFAELEKFIDTPVKKYSSGMYMRLAFAVAAHLEPEILLVDEVLAVGDAEFQKKCLGKMGEVAGAGRTVLFVSHNMGMISSLCRTAFLLGSGHIVARGRATDVVVRYYTLEKSSPYSMNYESSGRQVGDHLATLLEGYIEDWNGNRVPEVDIRQPFKVKMRYALHERVPKPPYPNFHFFDSRGEYAFVTSGNTYSDSGIEPGAYLAECSVPGNLLNNDTYFVGLALTFSHHGIHVSFHERDALAVTIRDPIDETLEDLRSGYSGSIPGPVRPKLDWRIRRLI